jgi:hypothetical protein
MSANLRLNALARYLIPTSLVYLSLPYAIFFVGWLKWPLALLCIGLVALPLLWRIRETGQVAGMGEDQTPPDRPGFGVRHVILSLLAALLLLGISGVGGYGYQDLDWLKHNAMLKDLIEHPWPVVYDLEGQDVPLVYYVAFYLPAACLGKLGGWSLANHALFAWGLIGLILAMLWFVVLGGTPGGTMTAATVLLLFVMFSGLDVIGELAVLPAIAAVRPEVGPLMNWDHIEQWAVGWQYSSNATLLFWVPNQALIGWIASGMLMHAMLYSPHKRYHLFCWSLTPLWSPFVTVGLLPYLLVDVLLADGALSKRLKRYVSLPNLCGLGLLAVVGLFYSAKLYEISPLLTGEIPYGLSLSFVEDAQGKIIACVLILVFCLLEFGLYGILVYASSYGGNRDWDGRAKALFFTTLICLSLFPLYRYGGANDLVMRASIPALFVLAVFLGRTLHGGSRGESPVDLKRVILILLVILGSVTALIECRRHIKEIHNAGALLQVPDVDQVTSLWSPWMDRSHFLILQYVGSAQAPLFRFMTKEPQK